MNLEENFKKVEILSLASSPTEASFFDLKRLIKLLLLLLILASLIACLLQIMMSSTLIFPCRSSIHMNKISSSILISISLLIALCWMVLGKISAELMFERHWSSLLGKNIYLNTSNTCSWRIMHCTCREPCRQPPHPTYNIGRAGSHTYTGIHARDLHNKIGLYNRAPILAGFGWICSGVLVLCANIALVWWVQDFVEFRESCNHIMTLRENQYEFQTLKCNILVWCTMWLFISMILMWF